MIRVGAYCRVSSDKDDQVNSFESQQRFFREYVDRNPEWELVEIFADEGISGTSTKKRTKFNKMISLALAGKIDLIVTKEVSRFARNTVDTLQYTRQLREKGVYVFFLNDNINTKDPDAELRLTIMASIAQEESRKTSERVKWGQKRRMEQGVVFGRDMLGYDVRGGKLYINKEGAKTVRLIYHKFLDEGKGTFTIARELREAGIETSRHMKEWTNTVILKVLRNEKYCGDLVQKKTFTPNFLTHEKKRNQGEEELVILRDHHEAIISRETFERAQAELKRRGPTEEQRSRHSNRYCFSGKIQCGHCGSRFISKVRKRKSGTYYRAWRCYEAALHGTPKIDAAGNHIGCSVGCQIRDEDFMDMVQAVVAHLDCEKGRLVTELTGIVQSVLAADEERDITKDDLDHKVAEIEAKKDRLIDLYTGGDITKAEYRSMAEKYTDDVKKLRAKQEEVLRKQEARKNQKDLMGDIKKKIHGLAFGVRQDETFYRNIIDRIVVNSREHIEIYLNLLPSKWLLAISSTSPTPGENGLNPGFSVGSAFSEPMYEQNPLPKNGLNPGLFEGGAFSEPMEAPRSWPIWRSSGPSSIS